MSKPVKAFLGKSYTKNGITKTYLYNPNDDTWGWRSVGSDMTSETARIAIDYNDIAQRTYFGETKANNLKTNIKTVIESLSDSNINGMENLKDALYSRINSMSDYEIDTFAEYNAKSINLYFEYKDISVEGVDARIINLAKALGINIYDYIESEEIPETVQTTLDNINDYIKFDKDFENADKALGRIK